MENINKKLILNKLIKIFNGNCKRILMINPPQIPEEDFDVSIARIQNYPCFPPYGIGLLCRNLEKRGYETDIIDLNYEVLAESNLKKEGFEYRIWQEKLKTKIDSFKPDAIGISCMYSLTHKSLKRVADFVKNINCRIPVIAGGVHASSAAKEVLNDCKSIDVIALYEGDISFPDMIDVINLKKTEEKLTQIAILLDNDFAQISERTAPSDESINPMPEYHKLNIKDYSLYGRIGAEARLLLPQDTRVSTVLSNRGCRGNCTFCSVNSFNGPGVRQRSIKSIIEEIKYLKENYNIKHIMWLDDDLLFNKKRAMLLFEEMIKENLNITWDASNGLVASAIDEEIMQAAFKSGCIYLNLGIESGSPEILRNIRKPSGINHFIKAARILENYPQIFTRGFLMIGFPGETIGQIKETVNLAKEMKLDWYSIQPVLSLPSTPLGNEMIKKGIINEKEFVNGSIKCFIGSTGNQRLREEKEKFASNCFGNLIGLDKDYIPDEEELKDIWFFADYFINYEPIILEERPIKLIIKEKMLQEITERKTKENPLSNLFLGIVKKKLNKISEANECFKLADEYMKKSAFWKARFEILGLEKVVRDNCLLINNMKKTIKIGNFEITDKEKKAIIEVCDSGRITEHKKTQEFERKWAEKIGTKYCVALNSGTSALIAGLHALKHLSDGKRKKVITSPITYIATSNAIRLSGLEPVYGDIDPRTFALLPQEIEKILKENNPDEFLAILPVHLMGYPCDMDEINRIAKEHGIFVFEDAAQAHGTKYKGKNLGSLGDLTDYSFYIAHNIQAGELGAIVTNNIEIKNLVKRIKSNGRLCTCDICTRNNGTCPQKNLDENEDFDPRFTHDILGFNFRANEFSTCLASIRIDDMDKINEKRREIVKYLNEGLRKFSDILQLPEYSDEVSYLGYPLVLKKGSRKNIRDELEKRGIETRTLFGCIPLQQPSFSDLKPLYKGKLPNAEYIGENGFYIGCHQYLTKEDLDYIIKCFEEIFSN